MDAEPVLNCRERLPTYERNRRFLIALAFDPGHEFSSASPANELIGRHFYHQSSTSQMFFERPLHQNEAPESKNSPAGARTRTRARSFEQRTFASSSAKSSKLPAISPAPQC
jgi:hypothetical protein